MRPHKGCHILLDAFTKLPKGSASLHFYGSGDAQYTKMLEGRSHGLDVRFHGQFDHGSVASVLSEVDLVVVPSLWEETYCLVAQEAMAARRPIVVTRVGGLADRVIHAVNGFVVPPNDVDAMADQLNDLVPRLPEVSASMDYDRCVVRLEDDARNWIALYNRVMGQSAASVKGSVECLL
jgi:glycosyltransferase involved in cell wall biosynthesis